jgi:hypothetical protein
LIFAEVMAKLRSFGPLTAPFRSWAVPTLFLGRLSAAYAPPPNEKKSATSATIIAADGWRLLRPFIKASRDLSRRFDP